MRIFIQQSFPLGRFHANPWRAFAFDDPHGEWPPSPWRLLRAILARSFQLSRELPADKELEHEQFRETLVHAFCTSKISWHLPARSWRGPGIQQYQPAEFEYSHPTPRKFNAYEYGEEFCAALSNAGLHHEVLGFLSLYKENKKNVLEFYNENMEPVKVLPDLASGTVRFINGYIKDRKLTARKYKHYFFDAKSYTTTKVKDNFWLTPECDSPLYWILEDDTTLWPDELLDHLDACLARMTYFGRAESITHIERVDKNSDIVANCVLRDSRTATAVPVLCPKAEATLTQVACMTNEDAVANTTTPPGAVWKYAERPAVTIRINPGRTTHKLQPTSVMQFAIGGRVFPPRKLWLRITEKFRGVVLRKIAKKHTNSQNAKFNELPPEIRAEYSLLSGKDAHGERLTGHRHAAFFLIPDEEGKPSRLICYRKVPFTSEEQIAILAASETALAWDFDKKDWKLRLVPLPEETPLPPSKNIFGEAQVWETLVPYVPPLHVFRNNGKVRTGMEVESQIRSHLDKLELPNAEISILTPENNFVEWVKVHRPNHKRGNQTNDDKRGYHIRLVFAEPIKGPLFLGHSSHYGLGLFAPKG